MAEAIEQGLPPPGGEAAASPATTGDKVMPLVDHLGELRSRLIKTALAVIAGAAVGFYFADRIIAFLVRPLPGGQVIVLGPGDAFFIHLKIAAVVGIILAMPVILYQGWSFIAPGLTPQERRMARPWIPLALLFFAVGVGLAYFILPYAIEFLLNFTGPVLVATIAAGPYFDFVTTLFLSFGLVMEFPIVLYGLSRVGIVKVEQLRSARRFVILGIAIFAAAVTPGGDLVSPFVMGLTMYLLYEGTIVVISRTQRRAAGSEPQPA
jgi:sec-independent protein translocase protein TatC